MVELRARAARAIYANTREARIGDGSPERGLSAAGMPDDGDLLRVYLRNCLEPVERTARAPAPRGDRAPELRVPVRSRLLEGLEHAFRVAGVVVRSHVPRIERDGREAALHNLLHRKERALLFALGVAVLLVVAVADQKERRNRPLRTGRHKRRHGKRISPKRTAVDDANLLAHHLAVGHKLVFRNLLELEKRRLLGLLRAPPELIVGEERDNLLARLLADRVDSRFRRARRKRKANSCNRHHHFHNQTFLSTSFCASALRNEVSPGSPASAAIAAAVVSWTRDSVFSLGNGESPSRRSSSY